MARSVLYETKKDHHNRVNPRRSLGAVCRGEDGTFGMILYIDVDPYVVKTVRAPASTAGLRVDDAIVSVNGERHVDSIRREFATARVVIIRVSRLVRFVYQI